MLSRATQFLRPALARAFSGTVIKTGHKVIVALGGNALLRRGQLQTDENQRENAKVAVGGLADVISKGFNLVIAHGNGPQVGLLALQAHSYKKVPPPSLDVLGAESEGQIGYILEQELGNLLKGDRSVATLLTQVEVDGADPAFENPTKFVGPQYQPEEAAEVVAAHPDWVMKMDGKLPRRVVPSPAPRTIPIVPIIKQLVESGNIIIAGGGGGIPVVKKEDGGFKGVEAVIDKDFCAELMARELGADGLVMLTDGGGVIPNYAQGERREIQFINTEELSKYEFPAGSMGPKVQAAIQFVKASGGWAAIGDMHDCSGIFGESKGTILCDSIKETVWYDRPARE